MLDISVYLTKIQRFQIGRNLLYCLFLTSLCLICGVEYTEFSLFSIFFSFKIASFNEKYAMKIEVSTKFFV